LPITAVLLLIAARLDSVGFLRKTTTVLLLCSSNSRRSSVGSHCLTYGSTRLYSITASTACIIIIIIMLLENQVGVLQLGNSRGTAGSSRLWLLLLSYNALLQRRTTSSR
jgi:hypothetical protein